MRRKRFGTIGRPLSFLILMMTLRTSTSLHESDGLPALVWRIIALMKWVCKMQPVSNARSPLLPVFLLLCNLNAYLKTKQTKKKINQFLFECAPYSILMKKKRTYLKQLDHKCFMNPEQKKHRRMYWFVRVMLRVLTSQSLLPLFNLHCNCSKACWFTGNDHFIH